MITCVVAFVLLLFLLFVFLFFFFKQKTAYEMRISDWSSDVCSSDLLRTDRVGDGKPCQHLAVLDCIHDALPSRSGFLGERSELRRWYEIGRASCRERVCQYV